MINLAIVTVYHDVTRLTRKKITRYNKCRANKHLYTKKIRIINTQILIPNITNHDEKSARASALPGTQSIMINQSINQFKGLCA